jgi:iron complex transport system ATP-binding protein
MPAPAQAVHLARVCLVRDATVILDDVSWNVDAEDRWVVLGPNGSGKTTLLQLITGYMHPTSGTARVLGHKLGRTDVRALRTHIAITSGAITRALDPRLTALDVAVTGRTASLAPWWDPPDDALVAEARALLDDAGVGHIADRAFSVLSEGERQRVLLTRMRLTGARLWVFDEPAAGLDLGAREQLVSDLSALAADPQTPPILFVTHHVEEIPPRFTHALLLRQGRVVASGPIDETMTASHLSSCFGVDLDVTNAGGRYSARARAQPQAHTRPET